MYSESSQTFKMKFFAKVVQSFQLLNIFVKTSSLDFWQSSKCSSKNDINSSETAVIRANCVYLKCLTLRSCLSSSSSRFSTSCVGNFGIVNRYSWFWISLNMADEGGEFSFSQGIHVSSDIRTDFSISMRLMTIKFRKQVHLQDLTQMRLFKQVLVTSLRQDYMAN